MPIPQEMLETVAGQVTRVGVQMVFGEAQGVGPRSVIPVAKVAFGFGAGGGQTQPGEGNTQAGTGGGGGGGARAVPVAVVEVSDDGVRVIPIVDVTRIRLAGFACLALGLWVLGKAVTRFARPRK